MSELISGKEALIALANGEDVELKTQLVGKWVNIKDIPKYRVTDLLENKFNDEFRLKPQTITLNGIEVPAPFEPKGDCIVFILDDSKTGSYRAYNYEHDGDNINSFISMWESEEEIKQVVAALRSIFNAD